MTSSPLPPPRPSRSRLARAPLASLLAAFVAASLFGACSPKDRSDLPEGIPGSSPAVGVAPTSSPVADAGADADAALPPTDAAVDAPVDAGACLLGGTFPMDGAFSGALAIRGTVSFPAPLPVARKVVLSVSALVGEVHTQEFTVPAVSERFTYRIGGLARGSYVVRVQADATGNGVVNDAGDYDGYYDGTAAGPILVRADAKAIALATECLDKVDFGGGVKP